MSEFCTFVISNIHGNRLDEVIGVVWTAHVPQVLNEDIRCPQLGTKDTCNDAEKVFTFSA